MSVYRGFHSFRIRSFVHSIENQKRCEPNGVRGTTPTNYDLIVGLTARPDLNPYHAGEPASKWSETVALDCLFAACALAQLGRAIPACGSVCLGSRLEMSGTDGRAFDDSLRSLV